MSDDKLLEKLSAFAARARRVAPKCDSEEGTKVALINPYLEILGYDIRDPDVCSFEFESDIGKAGEKVDYALMRDGRPSILIEAKAASVTLTNATTPRQLQRYFMSERANFAAFTNGVIWQWYRARGDSALLEDAPFLVHNTCLPRPQELDWLRSISGPEFDRAAALERAESANTASAILGWIDEMRHQPSDDLLKLIIKGKNLGSASAKRLERARLTFVEAFQTYLDENAKRLFDAAKEQREEEPSPERDDNDRGRRFELGDGKPPLGTGFARAWRLPGGAWQREPNGRSVALAVIRYLASRDARGRQRYYAEAVDKYGFPLFSSEEKPGWRRIEESVDAWVQVNRSNRDQEQFLRRACTAVQLSGDAAGMQLGRDVEVLLDI